MNPRLVCPLALLCAMVCAVPSASAQRSADSAPTGTVVGTITAGDTQRPARFAKVTLTPVKSEAPDLKKLSAKGSKDDAADAMNLLGSLMGSVTMLQAQTGLDGGYVLTGVAPGDYYLAPSAPGYVSPTAAAEAAAPEGASAKQKMAGVPVVHVEANHTVRGDAVMERGGALSGTVIYDDGSPAAGMVVQFETATKAAKEVAAASKAKGAPDDDDMADFSQSMSLAMSGGVVTAKTDDRGRFRLAGLPAGDYIVQAVIAMSGGFSMRAGVIDTSAQLHPARLDFYAPGTLHKKDAAKISVKSGEERGDIEIKADLSGMKSVSGRVTSAVDHHGLNAGTVTLTDTTDAKLTRSATVDMTGAYTVTYVPPGTYTLEVSDGADTEAKKKQGGGFLGMKFDSRKTVKSYEDASQPVIVAASDVTGVNVELAESKTVKKDMDMNDVMGGMLGGGGSKDPKE